MIAAKPPAETNVGIPSSIFAPWQQRVVIEKEELNEKIKSLAAFIATEPFSDLAPAEQDRLQRQLDVMIQYRSILTERIVAWNPPMDPPELTLGPSELQNDLGTV